MNTLRFSMDTVSDILLVIEARKIDAELVAGMISAMNPPLEFRVIIVDTLAEGIGHAKEADVVLVDLALPGTSGLEAFTAIRNVAAVPIIVLAKTGNEAIGLQAIREGAQDYLVFGQFNAQTLYRSILYAIERYRREIAESRLWIVLSTLQEMRKEMRGLTSELRGRRSSPDVSGLQAPTATKEE